MLRINIPGRKDIILKYLVLDMNGTIAIEGHISEETISQINTLAEKLEVFVLTADTFGKAREACSSINAKLVIMDPARPGGQTKAEFVEKLGAEFTAALGNGYNDRLMLKKAALGILVLEEEGCSAHSLLAADVVVRNIRDGLNLLLKPKRLVATLRD
ncbi:HAD family hydrolase [Calderihabitans maritimus]|uniref:HAD family hydrolase n=1 Tax=Calderihabitans maritimus TaxID=1246530 RepID=A0A1Z5HS05_9FIRM|nr:HAD family hydrolase [Calderihabitans maritimus]GAW92060.1 HAD family hydrolase [Calderihabitans maritimus]